MKSMNEQEIKENKIDVNNKKKILVLGLDNSGKTTIVLNLIGKKNLLNFLSLTPTIGADIKDYEVEGSNYSIWDMGGQHAYRKEYLEKFKNLSDGLKKVIYVIDMQDKERYNLSVEYFRDLVSNIKEYNLNVDFTIFLHKMDSNLDKLHPDITNDVIYKLAQEIKSLIPKNSYYEIFKSTIYTVFDKSIMYL